jgi:hypothetical protein
MNPKKGDVLVDASLGITKCGVRGSSRGQDQNSALFSTASGPAETRPASYKKGTGTPFPGDIA